MLSLSIMRSIRLHVFRGMFAENPRKVAVAQGRDIPAVKGF